MNDDSDVTRFPISTEQRIKNRRGKHTANCIVSGRYLRFGHVEDSGTKYGHVVSVEVMTDTDSEKPDRKMCEMILPVAELRAMLNELDASERDGGV